MYRKYIHLTRVQIEDAIDAADNRIHEIKCTQQYYHAPAIERRIQLLEAKITELYKALETKG
jgi:hypothetical protein